MLARLLLRLGIAIVDLDLVARALSMEIIRTHDLEVLDVTGTQTELRRRYAAIATQTGLPIAAQRRVAEMAWAYIAAARDETVMGATNRKDFSLYW